MDILLVAGFVFLGASGFVFIQLAMIIHLLKQNEALYQELEQRNKAYWAMIENFNNALK